MISEKRGRIKLSLGVKTSFLVLIKCFVNWRKEREDIFIASYLKKKNRIYKFASWLSYMLRQCGAKSLLSDFDGPYPALGASLTGKVGIPDCGVVANYTTLSCFEIIKIR